MEMINHLFVPF